MTTEDIYNVLTEILREVFDDPHVTATPERSAADIPEWDSFNHINIVVATEMRLGVKFRTSEIEDLRDVGEFVALIERKQLAA